jgi:hypothetical protein
MGKGFEQDIRDCTSGLSPREKYLFHPFEVFFCVYSDGVMVRLGDTDRDAVLEKSQLF